MYDKVKLARKNKYCKMSDKSMLVLIPLNYLQQELE